MGLIGWYKLDGNALDSAGNNDGSVGGTVSYIDGKIGQAFSTNASSGYITTSISDGDIPVNFSASAWVRIKQWGLNQGVFGTRDGRGWMLYRNSGDANGLLRFYLHYYNTSDLSTATFNVYSQFPLNEWFHVVVIRTQTSYSTYLNGVLVNSSPVPVDFKSWSRDGSLFRVGAGGTSWFTSQMDIDDARLYDYSLSPAEVKELSQAKVIHSKFEQNPLDGSGFDYHGVEQSTLYTPDSKIGKYAYLGDGASRSINYGLQPQVTHNQTIAMWIYRINAGSRMNPYNKNYGGEGTITHETSGLLNYYWGTNGGNSTPYQSVSSGVNVGTGVWTHIAVVRNLTDGYIRWFINGVQTNSTTPSYSESAVSTSPLLIGDGYNSPYHGRIDDFRLYATALTNDDILEIYQKRAGLDNQGNLRTHNINEHLEISNFKTPQGGSHDGSFGLRFTVKKPLVIRNALVRPYFTGNMTAQLYDFSTGVVLQETPPTPVVSGNIERVDLNLFCKPGISYWLTTTGGSFMRTDAGVAFPIDDGLFNFTIGTNITGTAADRWYYFFDIYYSASSSLENSGIFQSPKFSEAGITNGISGWWNFEGNANDVSGNGNDGIVSGAEIVGGVNNSGAYYFDGIDDYIRVDNNFTNNITELTTACWLKNEGGSSYRCAVHKAVSTAVGTSEYWIGVSTGNFLTATIGAIDGVGGAAGETTTTAVVGEWYHMTATWDGNVVRVYVNGVYNKQYNLSTLTNLPTPTRFGASNDGIQYQFTGIIDDVRIYNRALSAEEIGILYDVTGNSVNKMKLTKDSIYIKGQIKETL